MIPRAAPLAALLIAAWCVSFSAAAQPMGKTKEYRSLNSDQYKVSIQKDGRIDITLATDTPVITDVFPMIWFEGEDAPERMEIKGAWTERYLVEDKLGQGQGIHHQFKGTLWSLRAYPTRPYFAVQLGYTNETKKPQRIKALLPLCSGAPGKGLLTLGPGSETARVLTGITIGKPMLTDGAGRAEDALAILNPATGQSVIAGFITQDHGLSLIDAGEAAPEDKKNPAGLRRFQAMTLFDDAIELAPGETVQSEVLYLAIAESDPIVGLQRYARAVQVAHGLAGPEHDTPMHAWIADATKPDAAAEIAEKLRIAKARVPLNAVENVVLMMNSPENPGAAVDPGVFDAVRREGYAPVLFYARNTARTEPAALREEAASLRSRYGAISVAGLDVPAAGNSRDKAAIEAFREGLGPGARLFGRTPSLFAATVLDGVVSRSRDALYLAPQPARHAVTFDTGDPTDNLADAFQARLTAAVLLRCGIHVALDLADDPVIAGLLARVLPSPQAAARPIDLFAQTTPRAFHLHSKTADGDVHVAAVMNWHGAEAISAPLPLGRIGLAPGVFHTVYDYERQQYLGTAANTLTVTIPPRGAAVLVFRPVLSRPMLAATGTNLGQDWPGLHTAEWSPQARTFTVIPEAASDAAVQFPLENVEARYTLAVPQPYRLTGAGSMSAQAPTLESGNASATITFPSAINAMQGFTAEFSVAP